ncbi:MAG TPA: hypothetical protein DF637_06530 [Rikenellaceae bacterium]|nr:hypothetical protein [Rikenellaceae bacterium]
MIVAVASGKGGTGKTLIATNLFALLTKEAHKVNLADCDAEEPNSLLFFKPTKESVSEVKQMMPIFNAEECTYCGECEEYCNYNAIFLLPEKRIFRLIEDLCHGCGACTYACEFGALKESDISLGVVSTYRFNSGSKIIEGRLRVGALTPVPVIKETIKASLDSEIVILDAPPGTSCPFIHTISKADYVLLVTEPTPFGLNDLKLSIQIVRQMGKPFSVIINRAGLGSDDVYKYLKKEKIKISMELQFDKEIAMIYSSGKLVIESRADIYQKFSQLSELIIHN